MLALAALGCGDDGAGSSPSPDAATDAADDGGGGSDRDAEDPFDASPPPMDGRVTEPDAESPNDSGSDGAPPDSTVGDDASPDDAGDSGHMTDDGGVPPLLMRELDGAPDCDCPFGAIRTVSGRDDGAGAATAFDGVLGEAEIDSESRACRSAPNPELIAEQGVETLPGSTCVPPTGPSLISGVTLTRAFDDVTFPANEACIPNVNDLDCTNAFRPTALVQHPESDAFYMVEQSGRILRFTATDTNATVVLDIEDKVVFGYESGLLNLDFDPANPEYAYVSYITCASQVPLAITDDSAGCLDGERTNVYVAVARFHLSGAGVLERASERVIIEEQKPRTEHNGAGARFGEDGFLYVAWGDGGDFPPTTAQDPESLLGKILRLQVNDGDDLPYDGAEPRYTIPPDNPFEGDPLVLEEIYALGFRNPWRFDFDPIVPVSGLPNLFVGDVGFVTVEEIDHVEAGKNYGWPIMEGDYCRPSGDMETFVTVLEEATCNTSGAYELPAFSYKQGFGVAVTGGYAYRGNDVPSLTGSYVFADFSLGTLWALDPDGEGGFTKRWLLDSTNLIASFGQDNEGELYYFDWFEGGVYKLTAVSSSASKPPALLSDTGCVDDEDPTQPVAGVLPYDINTPFFSEDGVCKTRWLYLPADSHITEYATTGNLIFQPGTAIVKNFDVAGKRIETRILYLHADYGWSGWSYRWREDQSDADLLSVRTYETIDDVDWIFPDSGDCQHCHTYPAGRVLGVRIEQLNRLSFFPSTDTWANPLDTLRALGRMDRVIAPNPSLPIGPTNQEVIALPAAATLPRFAPIGDEARSLSDRVKSYLHSNCSHCHRPAGGGRGNFSLLQEDVFTARGPCNKLPESGVYDDPTMRVVFPGDPDASMIVKRLEETTLPYGMHPYRASVDEAGVQLIRQWIEEEAADTCTP